MTALTSQFLSSQPFDYSVLYSILYSTYSVLHYTVYSIQCKSVYFTMGELFHPFVLVLGFQTYGARSLIVAPTKKGNPAEFDVNYVENLFTWLVHGSLE